MSVENDFKKMLLESNPLLRKDLIARHSGENPIHLRLKPGCGFNSVEEMVNFIKSLDFTFEYDNRYSRSPDYKGHGITVDWNNSKIGLMLAVQKEGRIKRKELSPKNLGLNGLTFSSVDHFESAVKQSLNSHFHKEFLQSLVSNIKTGIPINKNLDICKEDISRITSDFGEVLAAFSSVCKGNKVIFPKSSNNTVADFIENNVPVSVKNPKGGGKVNLSKYRDLIDTSTNTGKLLYSIADHNKDDFFKYAASVSPLIQSIADLVGGTTVKDVERFVSNTEYLAFYNLIKSNKECKMLGIPDDGRPKELWDSGNTEPFYFTVNTLLNRIWGQDSKNGVSDIVVSFLTKPKFVKVDIANEMVVFEEIKFKNIKHWGTCYWSRATAAWHNWMAIEPLKEQK
tara:strand:+ start:551 stop:1744 length:1194 start_codon:yes stop_codon:yes gene_type:complete